MSGVDLKRVDHLLTLAASEPREGTDPAVAQAMEQEARTAAVMACRLIVKHRLLGKGGGPRVRVEIRDRVVERVVVQKVPLPLGWSSIGEGNALQLGGVTLAMVFGSQSAWRWCAGPSSDGEGRVAWSRAGLVGTLREAVDRVWTALREGHPHLGLTEHAPELVVAGFGGAGSDVPWSAVELVTFPSKFSSKCRCGQRIEKGEFVAWRPDHRGVARVDHPACVLTLKQEVWASGKSA